ncbi:phosphatidylinositol kinase [Spirochaetia bacterium]|nr:phosphatidylinositol kinase [Spirochaetia bacterium]
MILRRGGVYYNAVLAGFIEEHDDRYLFYYAPEYLARENPRTVSLTLPLQEPPFFSERLFSFFDGLIPEGWLLDTAEQNWKLDPRDRMGLLLACCRDTIGAVTVEKVDLDGQ